QGADVLVAHLAPGGADLEEVEGLQVLNELFLRKVVGQRHRGEYGGPTLTGCEFGAAVRAAGGVQHQLVVPAVAEAAEIRSQRLVGQVAREVGVSGWGTVRQVQGKDVVGRA